MRTCYLHIGMPKTGSTSIQRFFSDFNGDTVSYAQMGFSNHSGVISMVFSSQPGRTRIARVKCLQGRKLDDFKSKCKSCFELSLKGDKDIIISGESILQQLNSDDIREMYRSLRLVFDRVVTIAYVRPYANGLSSRYQTLIRMGLKEINVIGSGFRDFFAAVFENSSLEDIQIARFDRSDLLGGDVILDFAARVGANGITLGGFQRMNESMSCEALGTLLAINRYVSPYLSSEKRHRVRLFVNRALEYSGNLKFGLESNFIERSCELNAVDIEWLSGLTGFELFGKVLPVENPISDSSQLLDLALALPSFHRPNALLGPIVSYLIRENAPSSVASRLLAHGALIM